MAAEIKTVSRPAIEITLPPIPPLETGDHLTGVEFERRYSVMPPKIKAELIEGVVYMASPVTALHSQPHAQAIIWLGTFANSAPGVTIYDNGTLRLDPDNVVQPDVIMCIPPNKGGHARQTEDEYMEGAPELVVEVAVTTATHDLREKLRAYRRNGVQEYIVWQVYNQRLDWFTLTKGEYVPLAPDDQGVIHSQVFPGLVLAVNKLIEGDWAGVLAEQQKALDSPDHKAFVQRLAE